MFVIDNIWYYNRNISKYNHLLWLELATGNLITQQNEKRGIDFMKKKYIILAIFAIIIIAFVVLSLMLTTEKTTIFWIGFSFMIFALCLTIVITLGSVSKRSAAFPIEISLITFAALYTLAVLIVNILFGNIFIISIKVFLSIHITCLAIFAVIALLMIMAKSAITKQNSDVNNNT